MNNEFYIYLHLRPYTRQWLLDAYGDENGKVHFDPSSLEAGKIKDRLMRMPVGATPLSRNSEDDVAVAIPSSRKDPQYYHWMRPESIAMLQHMIENKMDFQLKDEILSDVMDGAEIKGRVIEWCHAHGVDVEHSDTLRQRINRSIMDYKKRGYYLTKHSEKALKLAGKFRQKR